MARQARKERKARAERICAPVAIRFGDAAGLVLQWLLDPRGFFSLADSILVATATTTAASATVLLVVVRHLIPPPSPSFSGCRTGPEFAHPLHSWPAERQPGDHQGIKRKLTRRLPLG